MDLPAHPIPSMHISLTSCARAPARPRAPAPRPPKRVEPTLRGIEPRTFTYHARMKLLSRVTSEGNMLSTTSQGRREMEWSE
jgi:hypothetical protein